MVWPPSCRELLSFAFGSSAVTRGEFLVIRGFPPFPHGKFGLFRRVSERRVCINFTPLLRLNAMTMPFPDRAKNAKKSAQCRNNLFLCASTDTVASQKRQASLDALGRFTS